MKEIIYSPIFSVSYDGKRTELDNVVVINMVCLFLKLRITRVNFMAMRMIIIGENIKMTDMEIHL